MMSSDNRSTESSDNAKPEINQTTSSKKVEDKVKERILRNYKKDLQFWSRQDVWVYLDYKDFMYDILDTIRGECTGRIYDHCERYVIEKYGRAVYETDLKEVFDSIWASNCCENGEKCSCSELGRHCALYSNPYDCGCNLASFKMSKDEEALYLEECEQWKLREGSNDLKMEDVEMEIKKTIKGMDCRPIYDHAVQHLMLKFGRAKFTVAIKDVFDNIWRKTYCKQRKRYRNDCASCTCPERGSDCIYTINNPYDCDCEFDPKDYEYYGCDDDDESSSCSSSDSD